MPASEFHLRAYHKPIHILALTFVAVMCAFVGLGIGVAATLGIAASTALAIVTGAVPVAFILWKNHRAQPAGVLRLGEGKLEYTAGARGPIAFGPGDVRDMVEQEGLFVLRLKRGAPLIIEPSRLEVPLSELRTSIAAWMLSTSGGIDFVNDTERAQKNENLRVKVMVWAGAAAILARLLVKLLQA